MDRHFRPENAFFFKAFITSFVKKGRHSAGVKRQYCGRLGKTENCQSGVFPAYAGDNGYGLVDCQLYIPQEWFLESSAELREKCHIPEKLDFSTKNEIGFQLIQRAAHSGRFPAQWIGCDAAYGCGHAFVDRLQPYKGSLVLYSGKLKRKSVSGVSRNDFS